MTDFSYDDLATGDVLVEMAKDALERGRFVWCYGTGMVGGLQIEGLDEDTERGVVIISPLGPNGGELIIRSAGLTGIRIADRQEPTPFA